MVEKISFPKRPIPIESQPPALPPDMSGFAPRTRSEEYARGREYVHELEQKLQILMGHNNQLQNLLTLSEDRNKVLTADLATLKLERDYHQQRNIETQTKLTVAAKVILDAMNQQQEPIPGVTKATDEAAKSIDEAVEAINLRERSEQ